MEYLHIETDVLVIGGGLAGLCAALRAREGGAGVIVAAKGKVGRSGNSIMARNSVAAVMEQAAGPVNAHIEDTMDGGVHLNDRELAAILAGDARAAILWLAERGVPFRRDGAAMEVQGSPGHSRERILKVDWSKLGQSRTIGMALTLPLLEQAAVSGVQTMDNLLITGLAVDRGRVIGAYGFQRARPRLAIIGCRAVVLACGGAGRLYPVSTNTGDVTGDGYALAHLAGAKVRDLEFIQFHPLMTLDAPRLVLSTAPFTEGAVLRNRDGEDFMPRYSSRGCLATRDVMALAILAEIEAGRGAGRGGVFMDFGGVPAGVIRQRYPDFLKYLKENMRMEVAPAAHFTMGGVVIDGECRSTVPGLYACGEAVGGVHGANRLAGNALTEAAVFGLRAGSSAAGEIAAAEVSGPGGGLDEALVNGIMQEALAGFRSCDDAGSGGGAAEIGGIIRELRALMGRHVGMVRHRSGLRQARNRLAELSQRLDAVTVGNYRDLHDYHQARLMLITAGLIAEAALARKKSLGAHYRMD